MTPPAMNTRNRKRLTARHTLETFGDKLLLDSEHFFTLANMIDDNSYVHLIQRDTCLYDIQDLEPEDIAKRQRMKKKAALKRRMQRIRRHAELRAAEVKLLRRELRIAHKKNRTEDGELGITWWSREYWDEGKGVKRLTVKKKRNQSHQYGGDRTTNPQHRCSHTHPSHLLLKRNIERCYSDLKPNVPTRNCIGSLRSQDLCK